MENGPFIDLPVEHLQKHVIFANSKFPGVYHGIFVPPPQS
jgi:hypothetical protein